MKNKIFLLLIIFLLSFGIKDINAQTIWENKNTEAQAYLARMAQKGLIQLNDIIQPIERSKIANVLNLLYPGFNYLVYPFIYFLIFLLLFVGLLFALVVLGLP